VETRDKSYARAVEAAAKLMKLAPNNGVYQLWHKTALERLREQLKAAEGLPR